MEIEEFTDTYSDDIIYLREAREALLTHPLRSEMPNYCNASLSRIYAIVMIGSIESMLEKWLDRDNLEILSVYFKPKVTNAVRINGLCSSFTSKGINVNKDVFDDYLAIKYIRNAIVHASWEKQSGGLKQDEIDWIHSRGFPTDTRKLNSTHWQRFEWVNENMMLYIALSGLAKAPPAHHAGKVGIDIKPLPDTSGIINWSDWPRLYWSNLERISESLNTSIKQRISQNESNWSEKLAGSDFNKLTSLQKSRHLILSAFASVKNGERIVQNTLEISENVSMCWNQFVAHCPEFRSLEKLEVRSAISTLFIMHENNIHPINHIFPEIKEDAPFKVHEDLVSVCFEKTDLLTITDIAKAYKLGRMAYRVMPNIMPLKLFSYLMPICFPERIQEWHNQSNYISDIYKLNRLWYTSIEGRQLNLDAIDYYQDLIKELSKTK
ncbi:hypothetical protein [Klebsiella variicola]|uniref:hypothetical protein n=1 Tax=Klebsiella variicola TaxID=244366 RepID=UPI00237A4770|nr:hypothetical protein [Klebsiella variicola]MDD9586356.1 hypothetical protein [Klebsiella variicola]MDD9596494.1 hypothetical protein [Klebsiella variicola]MDD9606911.1 hypothetical protein [Klebsiella variicola]MDD9612206.1 hypothetical protein [Klebsiella variicola]